MKLYVNNSKNLSSNVVCIKQYTEDEKLEILKFCNKLSENDNITSIESPDKDFLYIRFEKESHRNWFLLKFST